MARARTRQSRRPGLWLLAFLLAANGLACGNDATGPGEGPPDTSAAEQIGPSDAAADAPPRDDATARDLTEPVDLGPEPDVPPPLCAPRSYRCTDGGQPQRCRVDGRVWEDMQPCLAGEICVPNALGCARACTPPYTECASASTEWFCTQGGYLEQRPCPEGSPICQEAGHCILCQPRDSRCTAEGLLATCQLGGGGWDEAPCPSGSYCDEGACLSCGRRCLSEQVMTDCDAFGNPTSRACGPGETCFPEVGCAPCLAGERRCVEGGQPQLCAPDSSAWLDLVPCRADEACFAGACLPCRETGDTCVGAEAVVSCPEGGPNTARRCGEREICTRGACIASACAAEVVLLMDRSGSMSGEWEAVEGSVEALFALRADVRFGFLAFPGLSGQPSDLPPFFPETTQDRADWFAANSPSGGTPLNEAVVLLAKEAYNVWSLTNPWLNHFLIVLSDGEGQGCASHDFPIPAGYEAASCTVSGLAAASALLYQARGVRTVAIGYNYSGAPAQLLALTDNGGMSDDGFYTAGDEATLTQALDALFVDPKFCTPVR